MVVAGIEGDRDAKASKRRLLADGDIFGSRNDDEFLVDSGGEKIGVFKRFEYLSLPFTISGNREKFEEVLERVESNGTSFMHELMTDSEARKIAEDLTTRMSEQPMFTKQAVEMSLVDSYVKDNVLVELDTGDSLECLAAQVSGVWKELSDFYCIEGLAGGGGGRFNPFINDGPSSFVSGGLDYLENILPEMRERVDKRRWNEICLKISSLVGRSYTQIDHAVTVEGIVFGKNAKLSDEEVEHATQLIDELATVSFDSNTDLGKFYNTIIRFHNWMPIGMREDDKKGDCYDSICSPAKRLLSKLEDGSRIKDSLLKISDATSPKGLGVATMIDSGVIGSKEETLEAAERIDAMLVEARGKAREKFGIIGLDDHVFYTGLGGGKWKGIKLLHDAKEALGLSYNVPQGKVITSLAINGLLERAGISEIIERDIFSISEKGKEEIVERIGSMPLGISLSPSMKALGDRLIARSSMYGEDGKSNFSGTYESHPCDSHGLEEAVKKVIASYFNDDAIRSRVDIGLSHVPGISVIVQEMVEGTGGVIHITRDGAALTLSDTAEGAVNGNGNHKEAVSLAEVVAGTPLESYASELDSLHRVFGDIDLEFVASPDKSLYLTQMRPKCRLAEKRLVDPCSERHVISDIGELNGTLLDKACIVRMDFLGRENIMERTGEIMDFIRKNKEYVIAVEGHMPSVAHIPNKIEGHFRVPYLFMD